jgi:flagellar biosynthetic protein FlhB
MAEETDEERTEEPTGRRLSQARERGQIPRSRELNTVIVLMAGVTAMLAFGQNFMQRLWALFEADFRLPRRDLFDAAAPLAHLAHDLQEAGKMLLPFLGLTMLAALVAPLILGGWNFTGENLMPKLEKLDPIKGLGRMVSLQAMVELAKSVLKIVLVGSIATGLIIHYFDDILGLARLPLLPATGKATGLILVCVLWLCASLGLVAALDVPFQLWNHKRQLRMTKQEIKDEMRDTEGKPEVKARIRSLQFEMSRRRMMEQVPKADVVVTNPTHYAVALKYDQDTMNAPKLVAKGSDLIAAQIRNAALGAGVPLLAAPPLARAIYFSTQLDREIPAGLYLAVAQVLAYVYQLKTAKIYGGDVPRPPTDLEVPREFLKESDDSFRSD